MRTLLFVDDDKNVLAGLRRMLRSNREQWQMEFVDSAAAALSFMQEVHVDVLITDIHMPLTDGVQLLNMTREEHPGVARIVLSGHNKEGVALRSAGIAHQFLAKPCDATVLHDVISRTCRLRDLLRDKHLIDVVSGIDHLPSVPGIYADLVKEINSPNMSIQGLAAIIGTDVAMSAKVLQLVNSAFFVLPRRVATVHDATALLGTDLVRGLVLSTKAFEALDIKSPHIRLERLSHHCMQTSAVAGALGRAIGAKRPIVEDAMQASMLHDIGRLVVAMAYPDALAELDTYASAAPIHIAEQQLFGTDHARLGGYLLGLWGLPDTIMGPVAFHHSLEQDLDLATSPAALVHVANALVHRVEEGEDSLEGLIDEQLGVSNKQEEWTELAHNTLRSESGA